MYTRYKHALYQYFTFSMVGTYFTYFYQLMLIDTQNLAGTHGKSPSIIHIISECVQNGFLIFFSRKGSGIEINRGLLIPPYLRAAKWMRISPKGALS